MVCFDSLIFPNTGQASKAQNHSCKLPKEIALGKSIDDTHTYIKQPVVIQHHVEVSSSNAGRVLKNKVHNQAILGTVQ